MRSRGRVRRGFTLVELLVVIAVIAVLAAVLFPVFAKAREHARKSRCRHNIHQIVIAIRMYLDDSDGYMCPYDDPGRENADSGHAFGYCMYLLRGPTTRTRASGSAPRGINWARDGTSGATAAIPSDRSA
jgi:prepilin-type N-terminal cleavage/methylation domain-containing protein